MLEKEGSRAEWGPGSVILQLQAACIPQLEKLAGEDSSEQVGSGAAQVVSVVGFEYKLAAPEWELDNTSVGDYGLGNFLCRVSCRENE
jgi:hypothetical protein